MKYPEYCKNVIDVTKAPYFADNTGKTDCTKAIIKAIDDCVVGYITALEEMRAKLLKMAEEQGGNVYIGAEFGRVVDGNVYMTLPKKIVPSKFIYFPKGTYLVSDTITYSFDNLVAPQMPGYNCELCRNIHIIGENRENTVIKLADYACGFENGCRKPVVSFNKKSKDDTETTNCAQMNTIEDITIDCGKGNEGAVGLLYASSNCGRIENITIKGNNCLYGMDFDYSAEAYINYVTIEGFKYGMKCGHTSPLVFDNIDFSKNLIAGVLAKNGNLNFCKVNWGDIPAFEFVKSGNGRYYVRDKDITCIGDMEGNFLFKEENNLVEGVENWPVCRKNKNFDNWAFIDDFGAVGDGVTDSTVAIQNAMNSGKEVIIFGEGNYVISRTIKVPKTVKNIDFMYCNITPGYSLIIGEMEGMFDVCEESEELFSAEHFLPQEDFCGFFRMFKHSAKRPVLLKDFAIASPLYFNTANDNTVYFDNCFTLTAHYSQDVALHRDGYVPVFCRMIPVELHNQKAYGRNLNIERADIELLNDNSHLVIDGYKIEGPGKLVKSINGGKTQLNLFNAAWWGNKIEENCLFDIENSSAQLIGGNVFCYPEDEELSKVLWVKNNGEEYKTTVQSSLTKLYGKDALGRNWGRILERILIETF